MEDFEQVIDVSNHDWIVSQSVQKESLRVTDVSVNIHTSLKVVKIISRNVWKPSDAKTAQSKALLVSCLTKPDWCGWILWHRLILSWQGTWLWGIKAYWDLRKVRWIRFKIFIFLPDISHQTEQSFSIKDSVRKTHSCMIPGNRSAGTDCGS
jgi:hypothetical protein